MTCRWVFGEDKFISLHVDLKYNRNEISLMLLIEILWDLKVYIPIIDKLGSTLFLMHSIFLLDL